MPNVMRSKGWQKIIAARDLLQLGEAASLEEIKAAYRRLSKRYHPDRIRAGGEPAAPDMAEVNAAYEVLLKYCAGYRFPLVCNEDSQPLDDEDWWLSRFGEDPLWGRGKP